MDGTIDYVYKAEWHPKISPYIARSQQLSEQMASVMFMNQNAAINAQTSINAARNLQQMAAASAMANAAASQALAINAALAYQSWGNF